MLQVNAESAMQRLKTLNSNYSTAITQGKARQAYNIMLETIKLDTDLQALYELNTLSPFEQVATSITIHSLKVLARGRKYTDKEGETKFTPGNLQAQKILESGKNDTTGILEDLIQSVSIKILEELQDGNISLDYDTLKIETLNEEEKPMRNILNVVQYEFYQNKQKHYNHEYRPIITEDEEGNEREDAIMITQAMREYKKSIDYIGQDELMNTLSINLTDKEKAILISKLEKKQVERAYSYNGISKKKYVSRYKTLEEISIETEYSIKQVRTALRAIDIKCKKLLNIEPKTDQTVKTPISYSVKEKIDTERIEMLLTMSTSNENYYNWI